jgi:putative membrane protein
MLWLKAFHVIFVVTWFAGLFYLPRLFVYHAEAREPVVRERLKIMERRLLVITHIGAALSLAFGIALVFWWMKGNPEYLAKSGWFHTKVLLIIGLLIYHAMLTAMTRRFARDQNTRSSRWLRLFNEVPVLFLFGIVILVIVKPF